MKQSILKFIGSGFLGNAVWSSLDAVVYPALMLFATPIFIHKLGAELFGIWMLVNTIMASIGVLNISLGDAVIKFVSKHRAVGDLNNVHKVIGATYSIYFFLSILVMLVSFGLAALSENFHWFGSTHHSELISRTLQIAGVTFGLKLIEQIFLAVFKGYGRYDIASKISITGKVITVTSNIVLVYLDFSLISIFLSACIFSFFYLLAEGYGVYRFSGFTRFYPHFEKGPVREIFSFGMWTWFQSMVGIAASQIDKFIVVGLSDISTFAYYSIASTVFTQIHTFFAAAISWIFPIVSAKITRNESIEAFYFRTQFYFLSAVTLVLTVFFVLKDPLLLLWLGQETYSRTHDFINLFTCYNLVLAVSIVPYYFINASGHFKLNTIFTTLNLVLRLVCIPVFYYFFQNKGLVLALIFSTLIIIPVQLGLFFRTVVLVRSRWAAFQTVVPAVLFMVAYAEDNVLFWIAMLLLILVYYRITLKTEPDAGEAKTDIPVERPPS